MVEDARRLKVREQALRLGEQAATKLDEAEAKAEADLAALINATSCPPPPRAAGEAQLEQEIRSRLAAMSAKARGEVVAAGYARR